MNWTNPTSLSQRSMFPINGNTPNLGAYVKLNYEGDLAFVSAPKDNNIYVFKGKNYKLDFFQKISSSEIYDYDTNSFGSSIDCNYLGDILLVGDPNLSGNSGQVIVYYNGDNTQLTKYKTLYPSDNIVDGRFGYSVSLNSKGDKALIGAPNSSYAYVFDVYNGNEIARIEATDSPIKFGSKVLLNQSGDTAVLSNKTSSSSTEALYIFKENQPNTWVQKAKIYNPNDTIQNFGQSMTMNSSGNMLWVGACNATTGKVYLFSGNNDLSVWTEVARLNGGNYFGKSIELNKNGDRLAVSSNYNVEIFTGLGGTWQRDSIIDNSESTLNNINSLSLNKNGDEIFIGVNSNNSGDIYMSFTNPYLMNSYFEMEKAPFCHYLPKYITGLNFEIASNITHRFVLNLQNIVSGFYNYNLNNISYNLNLYKDIESCQPSTPDQEN
jgi:hypothetical protein